MNWAACVEWTNIKQQRRKSCFFGIETNSLLSDDEGGNREDGMEHKDFSIQAIRGGECKPIFLEKIVMSSCFEVYCISFC